MVALPLGAGRSVPLVDAGKVLGLLSRGSLDQGSLQGQSGPKLCPGAI